MTSPNVVKLYQSLAKPYIKLAETFERGDMKKLVTDVETARDIWIMVCFLEALPCMFLDY